ncbi:transposase [Methylobacterium sp. Leaf111]|uniref:IS1595 family transposase n=1 Tax=Methylobacterium sp. Leaf111 TaxID=1736257 RepID=UPI0006FF8B8D|nr:IS1595 family transposase [Methylobacterium sp. Leaf111]KQP62780.1 transposase [Methylobacterium sp. Leaf111]
MSALSAKFLHDEAAAFEKLESLLWTDGPVCPHCGGMGRITAVKGGRMGLRRCGDCKKQFTVTVGTVFESSHVKLHLWLQAAHLMCSSKKGFSIHQLHRTLGVTYKTAWFMAHRLREAMRDGSLTPMGGIDGMPAAGVIVEADETFIGRELGVPKARAYHHKMKVLSLLNRDAGKVRSVVVDNIKPETLRPIIEANILKEASLFTDESSIYTKVGATFADHQITTHSAKEYVRGIVHTNTVEGYFSVFKRGMKGVYQHCGKQHLHRYFAEFDFRYNNRVKLGVNDTARMEKALSGITGKRLTYRRLDIEQ